MNKERAIYQFRKKLEEVGADSNYSNQFLYNCLIEHGGWLIKREINKGSIYNNTFFFKYLKCQDIVEDSLIDSCCPVKTNCKIYRTKDKIPDIWTDSSGPIIKGVTSVDNSTDFWLTTPTAWQNKINDPYQKKSSQKYSFYSDGYIWLPEHNPRKVNILGFWKDDVSILNGCNDKKECIRYLETEFMVPEWLHGEMFAKAVEQIAGITKRLISDNQIDKNDIRRGQS